MVWKKLENLEIECWTHTANFRFGVRQPYLCLKASLETAGVLLEALDELSAEQSPTHRILTLAPFIRPKSCLRIRLKISPVTDELTEMSLTRHDKTAVIELTPAAIKTFRDAVVAWHNGKEDYSVGPSKNSKGKRDQVSGEIWFWSSMSP